LSADPFSGFDLEDRIRKRATSCGLALDDVAVDALALHAREVLRANEHRSLTAIVDPAEFVERHVGESLEGAAMLDADVAGGLLDLGSGNGYPGLPVALARRGLTPLLTEASTYKAAFLRALLDGFLPGGRVLEAQVQRPGDLGDAAPLRVVVSRAMGGWERVLPRFHSCLVPGAELLLWAGASVEQVSRRRAWRRFKLVERRALPGRGNSWVWRFLVEGGAAE
jgi:16S rRNA (guanine527-N7)-methyltransferase